MMRFFWKKKTPKAVFLGDLEKAVMEILWAHGPLSGREVYEKIRPYHQVALTTILTILNRLQKKGLVKKELGAKIFLFRPVVSQEEWKNSLILEYLQRALSLSPEAVISNFADILTQLSPTEFYQIITTIVEKRRTAEKRQDEKQS